MLTLSACLCIIILAFINAIFGQPTSDYVQSADRSIYFPPFFRSEGFYRSCLINLSFGGISIATSNLAMIKYDDFFILRDPALGIFMNMGFGIIVSLILVSSPDPPRKRVWPFFVLSVLLIAFSAWTATRPNPNVTSDKTPGKGSAQPAVATIAPPN